MKRLVIDFNNQAKFVALITVLCGSMLISCTNDSNDSSADNVSTVQDDATQTDSAKNVKKSVSSKTTHRYEVKSGIVRYKPIEVMAGVKTFQTVYFDDFGNKEVRESYTETNLAGMKSKDRTISVLNGEYTFNYTREKIENGKDVTLKEVQKMRLTPEMKAMLSLFGSGLAPEVLKEYDYKEEGTETIAGVVGKKVSLAADKHHKNIRISAVTYKNIPLKTDMQDYKIEAESFDENASVDASMFEIPAGYKVVDVSTNEVEHAMQTAQ